MAMLGDGEGAKSQEERAAFRRAGRFRWPLWLPGVPPPRREWGKRQRSPSCCCCFPKYDADRANQIAKKYSARNLVMHHITSLHFRGFQVASFFSLLK